MLFELIALAVGALGVAALVVGFSEIINAAKTLFENYQTAKSVVTLKRDVLYEMTCQNPRLRNLKDALELRSEITGAHIALDAYDNPICYDEFTEEFSDEATANGYLCKRENPDVLYTLN